jgi:hypothetical protein
MSKAMDDVKAACARGLVLAPVAALLLSVATLLLGNGLDLLPENWITGR